MLQSFFVSRQYLQHRMIFSQKPQTSDTHPQFHSEVVCTPRLAEVTNSKNVYIYIKLNWKGGKSQMINFKYLNNYFNNYKKLLSLILVLLKKLSKNKMKTFRTA